MLFKKKNDSRFSFQFNSIFAFLNLTQDLPTPYCKEARLTYVHMHEKVPRQFYFIVSSPNGVAEIIFNVNFTLKGNKKSNKLQNSVDENEALMLPEEIHFPIFGSSSASSQTPIYVRLLSTLLLLYYPFIVNVFFIYG